MSPSAKSAEGLKHLIICLGFYRKTAICRNHGIGIVLSTGLDVIFFEHSIEISSLAPETRLIFKPYTSADGQKEI